jgi:hypothetical protein
LPPVSSIPVQVTSPSAHATWPDAIMSQATRTRVGANAALIARTVAASTAIDG